MICRHCQLVEMERVRREGETNLYRCPKCGATQRKMCIRDRNGARSSYRA